ncbi:hypothetical protein D1007_43589 [Hordeum vulgare]|nr:hypothetical protein D1007_43589 [Hordeum vulgare]
MPIIPGRSSPSPPCLLRLPSLVPLSQTCPYLCFSQLHETRPSSLSSTSHPSYGCQIRLPRVRSARPDLPERLPHPAGDEPHQNQMSRRAIVRVARVLDHDYKAVVFQFCQLRNKSSSSVSECDDLFNYVGSSASRFRSYSEQDHMQDDHFPRYHYYHFHASCFVSITMYCCLPPAKYQPPNIAMKTFNLTSFHNLANHSLAMLLLAQPSDSVAS